MDTLKLSTETTTLVDLVEESILLYIKSKNLTLGDKLPNEDEICEQLNVGRNVVREALSRLRSMGIIDSRKKRGTVLHEPDIKKNLEKIILPNMLSIGTIVDLIELRLSIEVGIISTLFERITDKDIDELRLLIKKEKRTATVRVSIDEELAFHSRVYQITGNQAIMNIQQLLIPVYRFIHDNYDAFSEISSRLQKQSLLATHKDLFDCLEKKDEEMYSNVVKRHLMAYQQYIRDYRGEFK